MEKIWFDSYENAVPKEIDIKHDSIVDLFESSCNKFKKKIAYSNLGTEISYEKIAQLSDQFCAYLQKSGLKQGDRLAIMMPNLLQYPVALFGALKAGVIVVNTNPLYTADELSHQINDSGAETIVVLANFAHTVESALPRMPALKRIIITEIGDLFSPIKGFIVNSVVKYIKKMVPQYHLPQSVSFKKIINENSPTEKKTVKISGDDIAFLQYTGGTTGVAKGAILSHKNMLANVYQAYAWMGASNFDENEIIVTALPLYHIFSLTANCLTFLKMGAKNILITNPRDLHAFIKEIKHTQFTAITGVNTLFNAMMNHKDFSSIDFSKLKLALAGGMALQKNVWMRWHEKTGNSILEAYGLTETSPAVTINPLYLKDYNGSIGLPIPSTDIAIRDENGNDLDLCEEGELCIKGPQVMSGYWQKEDETKKVFWDDGFLRTGDIAKVDDKGFVYLVDRKKDMILVSGFNVYPNEVEQVLNMHDDIVEAGVVGVPSETGETVKACIVKRNPALTESEIIRHCREHLTAYKVPKIIEFYDELPKTNVGKILRRALK